MQIVKRNKLKLILTIVLLGFITLVGCTQEPTFDSFYLEQVGVNNADDTENPTLYVVSHPEAKGKVSINRNEIIDDVTMGTKSAQYDLEETSVTDEVIIIKYDGKEERFERTSSTVAVSENGKWYEYMPID